MEIMIAGYEMKKLSARTYRNGSAEILSCTYAGKSLEIMLKTYKAMKSKIKE
jgi:hypothetical protein